MLDTKVYNKTPNVGMFHPFLTVISKFNQLVLKIELCGIEV